MRLVPVFLVAMSLSPEIFTGLQADDWPQFLGQKRNGQSAETGLLTRWPAAGPPVLWKRALGVSMSGVAVHGLHAVTLFQDDRQQYVVCLNATDGSEIWRAALAPPFENAMGHGPRATPTISGSDVFAYSGEGILAAVNRDDGKVRWSVNVPVVLGGRPSEYGMSCSPVVHDQAVIVHAGTSTAAVAAFERQSGRLLWQAGTGAAGYASPVVMELAGKSQLLAFVGAGLLSLDPASGSLLWSHPFATDYDCNTANPVQLDAQSVLISAGENHGSVILTVQNDGGQLRPQESWSSTGRESLLRAEWQTPVLVDGHLYAFDNLGSAGPITNLVCIRLSDRRLMWKKDRFGKGNLIAADGKLFVTTMQGEVIVIKASPDAYAEMGRMTLLETTRQAPTLASGRLIVRDHREVVCVDIRESVE